MEIIVPVFGGCLFGILFLLGWCQISALIPWGYARFGILFALFIYECSVLKKKNLPNNKSIKTRNALSTHTHLHYTVESFLKILYQIGRNLLISFQSQYTSRHHGCAERYQTIRKPAGTADLQRKKLLGIFYACLLGMS